MKTAVHMEEVLGNMPDDHSPAQALFFETVGEALFAGYPGAVVVVDRDGRPVAVNKAGKGLAATLEERRSVDLTSLISKAMRTGVAEEGMLELGDADSANSVAFSAVPLRNGNSKDGRVVLIGRDISLQENLLRALVESRKRHKDLVECSSDFGWETDRDGVFAFVSPCGALGYEASELVGRTQRDLLAAEWPPPENLPFESAEAVEDVELWLTRGDVGQACVVVSAIPRLNDTGQWIGARGVCRDITKSRESEIKLTAALNRERLLADIVQAIRDEVNPGALLETAAEVTAKGVGAPWCWIYRTESEDNLLRASHYSGRFDRPLQDDFDRVAAEILNRETGFQAPVGDASCLIMPTSYRDRRNGIIVAARSLDDPPWTGEEHSLLSGVAGQLGIAIEQIPAQEALLKLSRTDDLTGLFNRRAFIEEIGNRLALSVRNGRSAAIFYIDLDNFKLVNDVHGHKQGDNALKLLAGELRKKTRATDPVARLRGDEFAVWFDGVDLATARKKAAGILEINGPLMVFSGAEDRPLSISIGVAVFQPDRRETVEELIMRADQAMYHIKHNGKGGYVVADAAPLAATEDTD